MDQFKDSIWSGSHTEPRHQVEEEEKLEEFQKKQEEAANDNYAD